MWPPYERVCRVKAMQTILFEQINTGKAIKNAKFFGLIVFVNHRHNSLHIFSVIRIKNIIK